MTLLTAQDTAVILRITPHQVYRMAQSGILPIVRVGRCIRIDQDKLEAWLEGGGYPLKDPKGEI